jgi:hypothetical protein
MGVTPALLADLVWRLAGPKVSGHAESRGVPRFPARTEGFIGWRTSRCARTIDGRPRSLSTVADIRTSTGKDP